MSFHARFDIAAVRLALGDKPKLSYRDGVPDFLENTYKGLLNYLQIDTDHVIPEINIKIGGQKDTLVFPKSDHPDILGRIIVNMGPDDTVRISKEDPDQILKKGDKKRRIYHDLYIPTATGEYLVGEHVTNDVILTGDIKRHLFNLTKKVNGQKKFYMERKPITRFRPTTHVSTIMVVDLLINMESKLAKEFSKKAEDNEDLTIKNFTKDSDSDSDEERAKVDTSKPVGRL